MTDITARKRDEGSLRSAGDRLEGLSRRLILAEESERRRIARELHDETGQGLMALKLNLQAILPGLVDPTALRRMKESLGLVDRTIAQVRNLSLELRPSLLDDFGLAVALRSYCDAAAERLGIPIEFFADPAIGRGDTVFETACYRIVQEALNNVAKHARASHVHVRLERLGDDVSVEVKDNGVGFDVVAARSRAGKGASVGVLGMQERATLVGGNLIINSIAGLGTIVRASMPFSGAAAFG